MAQTILIVDDEIKLREMIRVYLEQEGYRVVEASNGREAIYVSRYEKPDLILLDLMMPEMNGIDFMNAYGRTLDTPIIMLTARLEESDKVIGLELGADDYITKPFGVREFIARVRAVLRRANKQPKMSDMLRVSDVVLDRASRLVRVKDEMIDLTPSEFTLLETLMSSPGRAFSRLDLLERTSGDSFDGYERTVDVHIRNLRAKIEPNPSKPSYVQTVYGLGYRFAAEEGTGA